MFLKIYFTPYDQIDEIFVCMMHEVETKVAENILSIPLAEFPPLLPDSYNHVIDGYMFCPHLAEHNCNCRKPKPGMIHALGIQHAAYFKHSWMIGDSIFDVLAGWNAGIRNNILIDCNEEPKIWTTVDLLNI